MSVAVSASSPVVYFMAQEAHEAPVGHSRSSSSTSPANGMWEAPRQMQAHTPFPSWIPSYAGTFAAGAGLAAAAAAAPSLQPGEHGPDHGWNQSAPSVGAHEGSSYRSGNFLSLLEAKNVTPEMFEDDDVPAAAAAVACDYLGGVGAAAAAASSSSSMAGGQASACGLLIASVDDPYSTVASSAPLPVKHERTTASWPSPLLVYSADSVVHGSNMGCIPCHDDHEEKPPSDDSQRQGFVGAPSCTAAFLQQMVPSRVELQSALGYSGMVSEALESCFGVGSLPDDAGCFSDYNRSINSNRHERDVRPGMGMSSSSGSGAATSAATRRKSEERVGGNTKKSKQEASRKVSPPKPQVPKVKLGEKITALQQIVSPFGKTDTSSVLFETIEYIKFLHEQIRLFSEPYMTKSTYKGHIRLRGEEKEEESGTGHDYLRGRGLCLVPVSLSSQAYHDDTLPDCWAPAYRNCLYP